MLCCAVLCCAVLCYAVLYRLRSFCISMLEDAGSVSGASPPLCAHMPSS